MQQNGYTFIYFKHLFILTLQELSEYHNQDAIIIRDRDHFTSS